MAAIERGAPNIQPPFGFNRIITPQNFHTRLMDLLGVKYVLTLAELDEPNFIQVFKEGDTRTYRNKKVLPRTFFVSNLYFTNNKQDSIDKLFSLSNDLTTNAVVEGDDSLKKEWAWLKAHAAITRYTENRVEIQTKSAEEGFLVLTDNFYPTWNASIDGVETKIYLTDYTFRGIIVPKGIHKVEFYTSLF